MAERVIRIDEAAVRFRLGPKSISNIVAEFHGLPVGIYRGGLPKRSLALVGLLRKMHIEFEAKFLDIDPNSMREKLRKAGAKLVHPERLMRRRNFDYPDGRLEKIGGWIRVRDEGDKVTLAYKRLWDRTLEGTKEISVVVDGFDRICDFLLAVGLDNKSYQETKREKWELDGAEVTIDTWPWILPFVEVEASSEENLRAVAGRVGLDWREALHGSVETAYQKYYNVTEREIDSWESITFVPVPDWLEIRRR